MLEHFSMEEVDLILLSQSLNRMVVRKIANHKAQLKLDHHGGFLFKATAGPTTTAASTWEQQ